MPIVKTKWSKRLAVTLCTLLLFCAAIPVTAFADDVHIFTAYQPFMYFEKYDGVWGDLGTPPHSVVETGQPAYCLQMSMESPYGDGYDATDGSQYYSPKILNGLKAILAHGYPASTGGFTGQRGAVRHSKRDPLFPCGKRNTGNALLPARYQQRPRKAGL